LLMFFFLIPAKDKIEKYKKDPRQTYGFKTEHFAEPKNKANDYRIDTNFVDVVS